MNISRLTAIILNEVDILEYLQTYYNLDFKLCGNTYQTNCPINMHDSKSPSFSIPINEQYFKCFGCDAKGNVINFVEQYHNFSREDSISKICADLNISIQDSVKDKAFNEFISKNKDTCKQYITNLTKDKDAISYLLEDRMLTLDTIKNFKLGASGDSWNKEFSDRITFPIQCNHSSNILAFAFGYIKSKDNYNAKYINSKNNDYFIKSNLFYGYSQALSEIRKTKEVYIVEGYFDVISMHQSNLRNTMGIMCANISDEQMNTLKRLSAKVNLLLDNDEAGNSSMKKIIPKLLENGIQVQVITIPGVKDPDELCKKYNFIEYKIREVIEINTTDGVIFFIKDDIEKYNNNVLNMKKSIIKKIMPIIQLLPESYERKIYEEHINNLLKI